MVLRFDTEQSPWHVHQSVCRVLSICELSEQPEYYKVFALRPFIPQDRIEIIERVIDKYKYQSISLIIIDGISDLVSSVNELNECNAIVSRLLKWSQDLNCHIVTVLHENPGSDKLRGHLGTEVMNKAESTLGVEKRDDRVSIVSGKFTRNGDFPPFEFEIRSDGLPQIIGQARTKNNANRKSNKPSDYRKNTRLKIAVCAVADKTLTSAELNTSIINEAFHLGIELSDKPARLWIDQFEKDGFITNVGTRNKKQYKLNINNNEIAKIQEDGEFPL